MFNDNIIRLIKNVCLKFLFLALATLVSGQAWAQVPQKNGKDFIDIKVPDRILAVSDSAYTRGKLKYKADSIALRDSLYKIFQSLKFSPQETDSLINQAMQDEESQEDSNEKNNDKKPNRIKKFRVNKKNKENSTSQLGNNSSPVDSEDRKFFTEILDDKTPVRAVLNIYDIADDKKRTQDSINLTNLTIAQVQKSKSQDSQDSSYMNDSEPDSSMFAYDEEGYGDAPPFDLEGQEDSMGINPSGIVRENHDNYNDVPRKDIVIVAEQLSIDSIWVTMAEYYSVWNTEYVNPYNIDINKFDDTIAIKLYDTAKALCWFPPLDKFSVTSEFSARWGRWHHGIDLDVEVGDPVYAAFDGIVRISQYEGGFGKHIVLRHHNGLETVYAHLNKLYLKVGDIVTAGQQIGEAGNTGRSTGPHLHFEVRYQGYAFNPRKIFDFACSEITHDSIWIKPSYFSHLRSDYRTTRYSSKSRYNSKNYSSSSYRKTVYHTVRSGDTLWAISRRYKVSVNQLCRLNGISSKSILRLGKRLRIR
ncbi:MAG: LysM peptidoglycan-binding domain-containing protein [Cytophagales bacterium]|nr:MAG: LysM peptidoglycan-binding domain-containing protein [Cytophagales bacterium]